MLGCTDVSLLYLFFAEPATREGKLEARAVKRQVKESDEFLRRKGSEAPAVVALGFLSAAASALAPLLVVRCSALFSMCRSMMIFRSAVSFLLESACYGRCKVRCQTLFCGLEDWIICNLCRAARRP